MSYCKSKFREFWIGWEVLTGWVCLTDWVCLLGCELLLSLLGVELDDAPGVFTNVLLGVL